jgi:uncharacterized RmlC-like cupin family protein
MAQGVFANIEYPNPGNADYTPTTPLYASILDFPQAPREDAPAGGHAHPSGFVYGLTGMTMVNLDDGTHLSVGPGQAIFAPPFVHHSHSNPGNDPNDWVFIGLRPEAARTKPLPSPEARVIINTADIPPLVVGGKYAMRLDKFTIRPGGRSPVAKQGGPTLVYVIEGSDSLHQMNATTQTLGVNQASFLPQDSVYQLRNPSKTDESQALIMTMWLQNTPANTIVDTALN